MEQIGRRLLTAFQLAPGNKSKLMVVNFPQEMTKARKVHVFERDGDEDRGV